MSDETKKQAEAKLRAVANKIGYPGSLARLLLAAHRPRRRVRQLAARERFAYRRQMAKIGKPVDKTEWLMTPPTVNAYYNPLENNINFPAGILQPPFFNKAADDAVNFGAAGAVVGHELTHGFDDQGRRFDAQGNLRDWWTPADGKAFEERAACVANQYGGYTAVDDVKLNGKLTLGENVADNGGLRLAWMALMELMKTKHARHRRRLHAASSASSSAGRRCGARTAATRSRGCTPRPTRIRPAGTGRTGWCRTCRSSRRRSAARRPRRWCSRRPVASGE